jgi:hypothetical protein
VHVTLLSATSDLTCILEDERFGCNQGLGIKLLQTSQGGVYALPMQDLRMHGVSSNR